MLPLCIELHRQHQTPQDQHHLFLQLRLQPKHNIGDQYPGTHSTCQRRFSHSTKRHCPIRTFKDMHSPSRSPSHAPSLHLHNRQKVRPIASAERLHKHIKIQKRDRYRNQYRHDHFLHHHCHRLLRHHHAHANHHHDHVGLHKKSYDGRNLLLRCHRRSKSREFLREFLRETSDGARNLLQLCRLHSPLLLRNGSAQIWWFAARAMSIMLTELSCAIIRSGLREYVPS